MIDEPGSGQHYGGDVAGPVFANVMSGALRTLGVAPDSTIRADGKAPGMQVAQSAAHSPSVVKEEL